MGHKDLTTLYKIVTKCRVLELEHNWGIDFKWDQGSFETRIDIHEDLGYSFFVNGGLPLVGYKMWNPDILLLYKGHPIGCIEYEEESKPNKGSKRRKGHFEGNNHDKARDEAYQKAKLPLLKIWQSSEQSTWSHKIKEFLINIHEDKICFKADNFVGGIQETHCKKLVKARIKKFKKNIKS